MNRICQTVRQIYSPKYLLLNASILAIYYAVFSLLVYLQEGLMPLLYIPQYAVYALLLTASIALTLSIYSVSNTRHNYARLTASGVSVTTTLVGGVVEGCGCAAPVLFSISSLFGATSTAILLYVFFVDYSIQIFATMILLNVVVISYYLRKFSTPACRARPHATARAKRKI
jgi:hypothetical protein